MANETEERELLTTQETARMLGVSRATLYNLMKREEIRPVELPTVLEHPHLKFDRCQVEALLKRRLEEKRAKQAQVS